MSELGLDLSSNNLLWFFYFYKAAENTVKLLRAISNTTHTTWVRLYFLYDPGSTVNPAARTVATANTTAIKIVLFFIGSKREYESIHIFELRRIGLLFSSRYN